MTTWSYMALYLLMLSSSAKAGFEFTWLLGAAVGAIAIFGMSYRDIRASRVKKEPTS